MTTITVLHCCCACSEPSKRRTAPLIAAPVYSLRHLEDGAFRDPDDPAKRPAPGAPDVLPDALPDGSAEGEEPSRYIIYRGKRYRLDDGDDARSGG